jgi:serine protease AprX
MCPAFAPSPANLAAVGLQTKARSIHLMRSRSAFVVLIAWLACWPVLADARETLDATLSARALTAPSGHSRVIITTTDVEAAAKAVLASGGIPGRRLPGVGAQVALVPNAALRALAAHPAVQAVRLDRAVSGSMVRTANTVGASWVREQLGFDGSGVGVAVIDSGVADWHDDLSASTVVQFVDFVTDLPLAHDDYGHGTHVAGTIAGNGFDSGGARRGVAPGARLVVLKVLDETGDGHISNVIAAIDYAIQNRARFNIRIINLSVSSGVYESYLTDPLTQAAKRAVDAGIVVVTAAGNLGRSSRGRPQFGGVTSPGNAPWVLTVGASNHQGTVGRSDDTVAPFSSRGPTHIDRAMKPDVLAPGVAIESLAAAGSTLFDINPDARIRGTIDTAYAPYLSLSGTSMAAPIVTGTIALMLEANPALTPNLVKGILHYTAERRPRVDLAIQGAGMVNARGAVQLAVALARGDAGPADPTRWARHIIWGSSRVTGGMITADGTAWKQSVTWGAAATPEGGEISWGRTTESDATWGTQGAPGDLTAEYPTDTLTWSDLAPVDLAWASTSRPDRPAPPVMPAALLDRRWPWLLAVR